MDEPNSDVIEGALEFFILNALNGERMDSLALERQMDRPRRLLEYAAERSGRLHPGSLSAAIQRLERAGWVDSEGQQIENSGSEKFYFLTPAGKDWLAAEWEHRSSALVGFVESGALDDSFGKFLNRNL